MKNIKKIPFLIMAIIVLITSICPIIAESQDVLNDATASSGTLPITESAEPNTSGGGIQADGDAIESPTSSTSIQLMPTPSTTNSSINTELPQTEQASSTAIQLMTTLPITNSSINTELPQAVQTTLTSISTSYSDVSLVTADKYYVYRDSNTQLKNFYAEINNADYSQFSNSKWYYAKLSQTIDGDGIESIMTYKDNVYTIYFGDISSLSTTSQLYISIFEQDRDTSNKTMIYGPTLINVNYIEDASITINDDSKYISILDNTFSIYMSFPGPKLYSEIKNTEVQLLNSEGNIVARSIEQYSYHNSYNSNGIDERYNNIFKFGSFYKYSTVFNTSLYKAAYMPCGYYDVKVSQNGNDYIIKNGVQLVDYPIVRYIYSYDTGVKPATIGGNEVYARIGVLGNCNKDDFNVTILNENKEVIGETVASRYDSADSFIYKLQLTGNRTFEQDQNYYLKANYLRQGDIVFTCPQDTSVYLESEFYIYDYKSIANITQAAFSLKVVNAPTDDTSVELGIFSMEDHDNPIGTAKVTMDFSNVVFKDNNGNVASLNTNTNYYIKQKVTYSTDQYYWNHMMSIYTSYQNPNESYSIPKIMLDRPYIYTTSAEYDFEISLNKKSNNITDSSSFNVSLTNSSGEVVSTSASGLTVINTKYRFGDSEELVPYTVLKGKLHLDSQKLSEGKGKLLINIQSNDSTSEAKAEISILLPSKNYATSSNPRFTSTDNGFIIDGYAYMLKKEQPYDTSKFTYVIFDLNGNKIQIGPMDVSRIDYTYSSYQDYYSIDASVPNALQDVYYLLNLQYDGQNIYDLNNPSSNIISKYSSLQSTSTSPYVSWTTFDGKAYDGVFLYGDAGQNPEISIILYETDDKENFDAVKTIPLVLDPNSENKYCFTSENIGNLDTSKEYYLHVMLNGNYLTSMYNPVKIMASNVSKIEVSNVSLDNSELRIKVGEAKQLTATVSPNNASNKNVSWSSSNVQIATVDSTGTVKGVKDGSVVITVTTEDGRKTATCNVTVEKNIAVANITNLQYEDGESISSENNVYQINGINYPIAESKPLKLSIKGTNFAADKEYNYSISFNSTLIASGSSIGANLLSGKTIALPRPQSLPDGSYSCNIVFKEGDNQVAATTTTFVISGTPIPVSGITLNKSKLTLPAGGSQKLSALVLPENATNKNITWKSSNTSIAAISSNGEVTAVGAGTTTISAITVDGAKTALCTVNVSVNYEGTLYLGEKPVQNVWLILYKDNSFISSTSTDSSGAFKFTNLLVGDYTLQAYSSDSSYKSINKNFTINVGDVTKINEVVSFESKYSKRAQLVVNVVNEDSGDPLTSEVTAEIYNYNTNTYRRIGPVTSGSITFTDIPYEDTPSEYRIYLYTNESTDYYCSSKSIDVSLNGGNNSIEFKVPVTYKIEGKIKSSDGTGIANTSILATGPNNSYWGYSDNNGNYVIRGLKNGTYSIKPTDIKYTVTAPVSIEINNANVSTGTDIIVQKGMTLIGKVLKTSVPAFKAYVTLYDSADNYIASGYATGSGGYVFDGAIKTAGDYKLKVNYIYGQNSAYQNFVSSPVEFNVSDADIASGRKSIDINYQDPVNASRIFTGEGNLAVTDIHIVRIGTGFNIIAKYKNNGNQTVDADFELNLPAGVSILNNEDNKFSVTGLTAGASGKFSKMVKIDSIETGASTITIPIKVKVSGNTYDFSSVNLDVASVTLNGPGAVKSTESFKVYGEAIEKSTIVIKNAITGEVLASAVPNGRWYSAEIKSLSEGTYTILAEAMISGTNVISDILKVESRADQITIDSVYSSSAGSTDLPVNKMIGVRAFTAWVGPSLDGSDITIGTKFTNDSSITQVTYHFSDKDYIAQKQNGSWTANLTGWSGAGLKTITATATTSDNRTLEFIIAEVTVLVDPSGYVVDNETKDRLAGVTVLCEVNNNGSWEVWNAELYGQINPQITDENGNYGWMVPAGTYRVRAFKDGFSEYLTTNDPRFSSSGNSTIIIPPVRSDVNFEITPSVLVQQITLNTTISAITVGNTLNLNATVTPDDATNSSKVKWVSSDETIATVSNGVVTAKKAGKVNITATIGSISDVCAVTVAEATQPGQNPNTSTPSTPVAPSNPSQPTVNPVINTDSNGKVVVKSSDLTNAETLTVSGAIKLAFDKAAVEKIKSLGDTTITIAKSTVVLSDEAKALVGTRPVFELSVKAGSTDIGDFNGGMLKIEIPYTLGEGEDSNAIVIYYVDSNGKLNLIKNSAYNIESKTVIFNTTHLSTYAVGYNKVKFVDVSGWADSYITFLSSHGIVSGVGNDKFNPEGNITRGDFVTILARLASADLSNYSTTSFKDVKTSDYYSKAIEWAVKMGITDGVGKGNFAPKAYITRQDMAVMISRFAKAVNFKLSTVTDKVTFADDANISNYATEAVKSIQMAGLISGFKQQNSNELFFAPQKNATRAETAVILTRLLVQMINK